MVEAMTGKKFIIEMEFEDEKLAGEFVAYWLDGGGSDSFLCYDDEGKDAFYTKTQWDWKKYKGKTIKKFTIERSDVKYE